MPAIISGGSGAWRSRGRRDARPKPVRTDMTGFIDQHMGRLDVLVDEALLVDFAKSSRQADGKPQKASNFKGASGHSLEQLTARIGEHQQKPPALVPQLQRACGPGRIELTAQRKFLLQPSVGTRRWLVTNRSDSENCGGDPIETASRKPHLAVLPQRFDNVQRRTDRGGQFDSCLCHSVTLPRHARDCHKRRRSTGRWKPEVGADPT